VAWVVVFGEVDHRAALVVADRGFHADHVQGGCVFLCCGATG
jgi:hypothetical protein